MATQARGLIRDQNLSVHFDVAPLGVKTNVSKSQKNGGGLGGRKKLRKAPPLGVKTNVSKSQKNGGGLGQWEKLSEALSDLTNSGKPYARQSSNDSHSKKLRAFYEELDISEELEHDHRECIKAQECEGMDIDDFLLPAGLKNDNTMELAPPRASLLSSKLKADSPPSFLEREEMYQFLGLDAWIYGPVE